MKRTLLSWCSAAAALVAGQQLLADQVSMDNLRTRYEWRANTFTRSSQSQAAIAAAPDGALTAVWSSRRQQDGQYGIYAQRFDARGVAVGGESVVNLWTTSHQTHPDIAVDAAGNTWIVWQSHGQDGDAGSIIARRFDQKFVGGSEVLVNENTLGHQSNPVIELLPDGRAVIIWTTTDSSGIGATRVSARIFNPDGASPSGELKVSTATSRNETVADVAADLDGNFAIVFAITSSANMPLGIRMQRFDGDGKRLGDEVAVTEQNLPSQIEPVIASIADRYVVAWLDAASDGHDYGVVARMFDHDGCALNDAFVVNEHRAGSQTAAAIAATPSGAFTIAWNGEDDDGSGVFIRMFASDGTPLSHEARLNRHEDGDQTLRAATGSQRLVFASDTLACVWSGDAALGDDSAVNITMLTHNPLELAGASQGVTAEMQPAQPDDTLVLTAAPHVPPTFDPKQRQRGPRTILEGANVGFDAIINTGWTPPDPHMAVGPNHVVVMTNGAIAFFEKDGTLTFQDEIEDSFGFWGGLGTTGFVFDPEVLYDEISGRFFAMAAEAFVGASSFVLIAVSDDSDPNGEWFKYRISTTVHAGNLFDSPNIGVDDEAVYITGDGFGFGANYPIFIFDKAPMLVGGAVAVVNSFTLSTSTQSAGIPPVTYDDPPALYLCEHRESGNATSLRLIALQDPLGSVTTTDFILTVPAYSSPEDPPQMGTGVRPETFDQRFWSVAFRNGSLWATHHVSNPVRARWYEIAMNGWPDSGMDPELVQSGDIDPGDNVRTYFTSVTVDDQGNAALCFARSSASEFISMATAYRAADDPLGTFQPMEIWQVNNAGYTTSRWGDYSAIEVDPADGITIWAHHEYALNNSWRTWVQSFTPEIDVLIGDIDGDGIVGTLDLLILLGAWGPCDDCDDCPGDIDFSCDVGVADLLLLLGNWS